MNNNMNTNMNTDIKSWGPHLGVADLCLERLHLPDLLRSLRPHRLPGRRHRLGEAPPPVLWEAGHRQRWNGVTRFLSPTLAGDTTSSSSPSRPAAAATARPVEPSGRPRLTARSTRPGDDEPGRRLPPSAASRCARFSRIAAMRWLSSSSRRAACVRPQI